VTAAHGCGTRFASNAAAVLPALTMMHKER
jgi:hypothetical protein